MYLYLHQHGYLINWTLTAMASMTALTIFPAVVVARCLLCRLCVVSQCVCVCVWLFFLVLLLLFLRLCCASYDLFDSHANILHNFNSLPSSSFTSAAAFSFTFFSYSPLLWCCCCCCCCLCFSFGYGFGFCFCFGFSFASNFASFRVPRAFLSFESVDI